MITLLVGKKGSGKTKKLIQMANDAVAATNGNVVCIEKGAKLTYDINHKARLVDIDQYGVEGFEALYGFVAGNCAGNYDLTDVLIDSTLKIGGRDFEALADFVEKVEALAKFAEINVVISVSADESELPERMNAIIHRI